MADIVRRYERLKAEIERLRSEQDRREGSLESLMKRLKGEYGLKTVEAAVKEIAKQERIAAESEEEANGKMDQAEGLLS